MPSLIDEAAAAAGGGWRVSRELRAWIPHIGCSDVKPTSGETANFSLQLQTPVRNLASSGHVGAISRKIRQSQGISELAESRHTYPLSKPACNDESARRHRAGRRHARGCGRIRRDLEVPGPDKVRTALLDGLEGRNGKGVEPIGLTARPTEQRWCRLDTKM
jgi:hypothetical protein